MNKVLYNLSEKIRRGEPVGPILSAALELATLGVRAGMWARLQVKPHRVGARVISYGNITAGGTGKTPAVIERAQAEITAGRRVAVLTRGYGTRQGREPVVVDTAESASDLYAVVGDEPALIALKAPGVVIVKSPDRVKAARIAIEEHACDTLILDDGFQHVRLARDENVCVIDATNPFGSGASLQGRLVPRGILRENADHIRRATHLLVTRCDLAADLGPLLERLWHLHPEAPVRLTRHAPDCIWRVCDGQHMDLQELRGTKIAASCAIAAPETFFETLRNLGADLTRTLAYPDHSVLPPEAVAGSDLVVVTEKDAVRMWKPQANVYALGIRLQDFARP